MASYSGVVGVGHNAGNTAASTRLALRHGADAVEIDVIALGGQLYAGHSIPARSLSRRLYQGPRLSEAWDAAGDAAVIQLDIKQSAARLPRLLLAFLAERADDREVIVSSAAPSLLRQIATEVPSVRRFLSVPDRASLDRLQEDLALVAILDGVTIHHALLDEPTMGWLRARGLRVFVWTVNDVERINELVRLGVDGVTTDNLAILELLGDPQPTGLKLARRLPAPRAYALP